MTVKGFFLFSLISFSIFSVPSGYAADAYKRWNVSLPIVAFGGEGVSKFEMNLGGQGALGVEFAVQQESEFFTQKEVEEHNNDSLLMKGTELSVLYSSYGNPKMLSGGFWSVGLGYRSMKATWYETPGSLQNIDGISLTTEGKMQHDMATVGATARARIGYRYVATSIPFSAGAYIGVRHYQNKFKDVGNAEEGASITPAEDLKGFERRMTSRLEPGIELGLSF